MKTLLDTNVVLDVLLKRVPYCDDSYIVFKLAESGRINGILAAVSMTNVFYLLQKTGKSSADVYKEMDKLITLFSISPVTETTISNALAMRWKDFEDAVQFITAKENSADLIITRNKEDFNISDIPCITPTEFIAYLKEKENE